jgi:hypothetical protein
MCGPLSVRNVVVGEPPLPMSGPEWESVGDQVQRKRPLMPLSD